MSRVHSFSKPHNIPTERWIRSNTKVGPVLDVKLYPHQGRYCIDIMIESLSRDRTVSWVRIVSGINKYVQKRQKKYPLRTLICSSAHGNLWQRLSQDRNLLWICLPVQFLSVKDNGKTLIHINSITVVLKCQNSWPEHCDTKRQFLEKLMEQ